MKKTLCILFGGKSAEYPISLISASSIIATCRDLDEYQIITIGISREGKFYQYLGEEKEILEDAWQDNPAMLREVFFKPGDIRGFLSRNSRGQLEIVSVDVFFPVLHGADGEGGPLQGFLDTIGVPYVGCQQLAAATMMDKTVANMIFDYAGIRQTPWFFFNKKEYLRNPNIARDMMAARNMSFPIFVKPACTGSSVGISQVKAEEGLAAALDIAFAIDDKILIEQAVKGRELEVAVLEKADGEYVVSIPGEIIPGKDFYDFEDKYAQDSQAKLHVPARLTPEQTAEIRRLAELAFRMADCRGLSRVDFFLRENDREFLINEINTMPGFTSISMFGRLLKESGVEQVDLMRHLIEGCQ